MTDAEYDTTAEARYWVVKVNRATGEAVTDGPLAAEDAQAEGLMAMGQPDRFVALVPVLEV